MKIVQSVLAVEQVSAKIHKQSRSMSNSYHKRVQKKWDKRFGYIFVPSAYVTSDAIIAHPEVAKRLKEHAEISSYEPSYFRF